MVNVVWQKILGFAKQYLDLKETDYQNVVWQYFDSAYSYKRKYNPFDENFVFYLLKENYWLYEKNKFLYKRMEL